MSDHSPIVVRVHSPIVVRVHSPIVVRVHSPIVVRVQFQVSNDCLQNVGLLTVDAGRSVLCKIFKKNYPLK